MDLTLKTIVHPNIYTKLYHGFKGYKVLERQTCNRVQKEKGDIGSHIPHPKMQEVQLDMLNLTKLWKDDFLGIDPFKYYPSQDTLPEEEEYTLGVYGDKELVLKDFPTRQTIAPNPNSLIFKHRPTIRLSFLSYAYFLSLVSDLAIFLLKRNT